MRLKVQEGKIENSLMKLQRHDKNLFNKCVTARIGKDSARAAMYASECAEIRKMAKTTLGCQLALEKAVIRLRHIILKNVFVDLFILILRNGHCRFS